MIIPGFKCLGGVWKLWVKGSLVEWQIDLDFEVGQGIKLKPTGIFLPYKCRKVLRGKKTLVWAELRKHLCLYLKKKGGAKPPPNPPTIASSSSGFFHCLLKHPVQRYMEAIQGSLGNEAGKMRQLLALRSLPSNKLARFIALKDSSHWSWWQGCLPSLGKEDQRTLALWEKGSVEKFRNPALCLQRNKPAGWEHQYRKSFTVW